MKPDITLYAILDPNRVESNLLEGVGELATQVAEGGATVIQYRHKNADTKTMIKNTREIMDALKKFNVPLIVNDRVDVAVAANADGVHLGQDDMHPEDAKKILRSDAIIGQSIKTNDDADNIPHHALDYVFVGGVFETMSKDNATIIGVDGWKKVAMRIREKNPTMPIGAIAGINKNNMKSLWDAGADGIAIISAIFATDNPKNACKEISQQIKEQKR